MGLFHLISLYRASVKTEREAHVAMVVGDEPVVFGHRNEELQLLSS